jgi:hypothetical protein
MSKKGRQPEMSRRWVPVFEFAARGETRIRGGIIQHIPRRSKLFVGFTIFKSSQASPRRAI